MGVECVSERANPALLFKIRLQIHFLPPTIPTTIFHTAPTPIFIPDDHDSYPLAIFHTIFSSTHATELVLDRPGFSETFDLLDST